MHILLGEQLELLCKKTKSEALLVAPFIKESVLRRLLECISSGISVRIVTRWNPLEIKAGVSDLSIWPLINQYSNVSLFLCSSLHAKYFKSDDTCLVGSANLTGKALGWNNQPNLEFLIEVDSKEHSLVNFEQYLFANSVLVNESIYLKTKEAVDVLPPVNSLMISDGKVEVDSAVDFNISNVKQSIPASWLPTTRFPENLYRAYCGEFENLTKASVASTRSDLHFLSIQAGLSAESFNLFVGTQLLQSPIVSQIDKFLETPQRFGAVISFLKTLPCSDAPDFDASHSWQTLIRWFMLFLPARYSKIKSKYSEVFVRTDA